MPVEKIIPIKQSLILNLSRMTLEELFVPIYYDEKYYFPEEGFFIKSVVCRNQFYIREARMVLVYYILVLVQQLLANKGSLNLTIIPIYKV